MFPPGFTHEGLYPWWRLLAAVRRTFHCFTCLTRQLPRDLAHHLWLRFFSDSYGKLQSVPAVLFAIGAPGAGSKIDPAVFTQSDARSLLPTPGGEPHTVLFRREDSCYLVPFVVPGG